MAQAQSAVRVTHFVQPLAVHRLTQAALWQLFKLTQTLQAVALGQTLHLSVSQTADREL
jgi:hypothetical protein